MSASRRPSAQGQQLLLRIGPPQYSTHSYGLKHSICSQSEPPSVEVLTVPPLPVAFPVTPEPALVVAVSSLVPAPPLPSSVAPVAPVPVVPLVWPPASPAVVPD